LFLGAGSVMHAMGGVIDMRRFGGLRRLMPRTHWTFLFGCLALAGVAPFAGFWSKDAIMAAVHDRAHHDTLFLGLYYTGWFVAFLTAFYTFRGFFLTFYGEVRVPYEAGHHAHESPPAMTVPLMILAVCALVVGGYFEWTGGFADFLAHTPSLAYQSLRPAAGEAAGESHRMIEVLGTAIALSGVGLAAFLYLGDRSQVDLLTRGLRPLYWLSHGKLFFDEIYAVLFVWPLWLFAQFCAAVDRLGIDGLVNFVGRVPPALASRLRPLQTGMVQFYALAMVWGVLVLIATLLIWPALGGLGQ
jgi:NADH-quinone oxidoreductase subunit L